MGETLKEVMKNPKRLKHGKKSHETYMKKLKEGILKENQFSTLLQQITLHRLQVALHLLPLLLLITLPLYRVILISMALV